MKKILLTTTMLVCLSALSKAQQGRVGINTTAPDATLDVKANTTAAANNRPDAVLVPRMTAAELSAKDDTSGTYGAAQNGALVYITSGTGSGPRKSLITGPGFYYFDSAGSAWKPLGGGGSATDTSIYLNDGSLAGNRIVNQVNNNLTFTTGTGQFIVDGTNNLKGAQFMNIRVESATNFTVQPNDYMIHWTASSAGVVTLPAASSAIGRELCFFSENNVLNTGAIGNGGNVNPGFGTCIISNGTTWITKNSY